MSLEEILFTDQTVAGIEVAWTLSTGFFVERGNLLIDVKRKLQAVNPQGRKYRRNEQGRNNSY